MTRRLCPVLLFGLSLACGASTHSPSTVEPNQKAVVSPQSESTKPALLVRAGRVPSFEAGAFLVSDFESGTIEHGWGGKWKTSSDPHHLGTTLLPNPLVVSAAGASGSKYGLRIHGHFGRNVEPWPYADVRASFSPADLSSVETVRFHVRGDGKKYILALVRETVVDFAHYRAEFVAPKEWTQVELPLMEEVQG